MKEISYYFLEKITQDKDEPIPEERQAEYITINFSVKGKMVEPTEQHMNYSKKYLTKAKEIWGERNGIK